MKWFVIEVSFFLSEKKNYRIVGIFCTGLKIRRFVGSKILQTFHRNKIWRTGNSFDNCLMCLCIMHVHMGFESCRQMSR